MNPAGLLVFATAYALLVMTPGPGIAALLAQVLGRGLHTAPALIAGFLVGDLVWFGVAALGLATVAHAFAGVFGIIKWLGIGYLMFIAWRMWTAPVAAIETGAGRAPQSQLKLFLGSLSLTLGNPKAIVFFLALLPAIVDLAHLTTWGFAEAAIAILIVQPAILMVYALAAHWVRGLFRSPRAMRNLNRVSGTAIAGAAVAIAARG